MKNFLFEFKMSHKAGTQLATSTTHLAQELLMNIQCSGGSRNSAKETSALKMSIVASHHKLTMTNWKQSQKLILLQLHKKLPKNSKSTMLWSFGIWSKLEKWKSSLSGCLMRWRQIKKKKKIWSVVSFCFMKQWAISRLDCDMWQKVHFTQPVTTSSVAGWRRCSRALLKAKPAPRKVMVTVWWSAAGVIHYSFLNPG